MENFDGRHSEPDFDSLTEIAYSSYNPKGLLELWKAVFSLQTWAFIAKGSVPDIYPFATPLKDIADNQPLVLAFTDIQRCGDFVKNTSLAGIDKQDQIITIPTEANESYLEGLRQSGYYGIWFNADAKDGGFYGSFERIGELRIESRGANPDQYSVLMVGFRLGIDLPDVGFRQVTYDTGIYALIPNTWISETKLAPGRLDQILDVALGSNWRNETSEGGKISPGEISTFVFPAASAKNMSYSTFTDSNTIHYTFLFVGADGTLSGVSNDEFQVLAEINL
ncbi:MAG: hypothetical protein ACK5NT_00800 [Pyrinomonadaceae bacterium]